MKRALELHKTYARFSCFRFCFLYLVDKKPSASGRRSRVSGMREGVNDMEGKETVHSVDDFLLLFCVYLPQCWNHCTPSL